MTTSNNAFISDDSTPAKTPYDLIDVLKERCAKHVVICGQNLFRLVTHEDFELAVDRFLAREGTTLDILLCDFRYGAGVLAWSQVHPVRRRWEYAEHLYESSRLLAKFGKTRQRLRIRVVELNSFSGWFKDPTNETEGVMVITPAVPGLYDTLKRPQVFVRRSEAPDAFKAVYERVMFLIDTPASRELKRPSRIRCVYYKVARFVATIVYRILTS